MSAKPREHMPSHPVKTFDRRHEKSVQQLLPRVRESEGALLKQPAAAVCVKRAARVRPPAFQTGCYEFEFRFPSCLIRRRSVPKKNVAEGSSNPFSLQSTHSTDCEKVSHMTVSYLVLARISQVAWTP